jgi:hypothetical protein
MGTGGIFAVTHMIRILDHSGDTPVVFDPAIETETERAERRFNELKAQGYLMARYNGKSKPADQIDVFDPTIVEVIAVPQRIGG